MSDMTAKVTGGDKWKPALKAVESAQNCRLEVGVLEGATYGFAAGSNTPRSVATLAYWHEFGIGRNKKRPFLTAAMSEHGAAWGKAFTAYLGGRVAELVKNPIGAVKSGMDVVGLIAVDDIRSYINQGKLAPLTPKRIRRKELAGYGQNASLPLAFTGTLGESIAKRTLP